MAMFYDYMLENGKNIRIPKNTIENLMKTLKLSEEDAIQVYLEDEGYEINEEQEELTKKAKENRITATIHKAEGKTREKRKVERRANPDKEELIRGLAEYLTGVAADVKVTNIGKLIEFKYNDKLFKLDLIETRIKK